LNLVLLRGLLDWLSLLVDFEFNAIAIIASFNVYF